MGRGRRFLKEIAEDSEVNSSLLPGKTIVEIAEDRRVLIENHFGVKAYSREGIIVKVRFGYIKVCGCELEILRMTREQLIICGQIQAVTLQRRERR